MDSEPPQAHQEVMMHHLLRFIQQLRGGLLKTGQTTQYNSELDDGYYEMGLARQYAILTVGQYAGTTNVTVNAKTDVKTNNCVRDLVTGLMWSRTMSASVGPGNDGQMWWTGAVDDIFAYCAAANAANLGGHNDWRIPNRFELESIYDYSTFPCSPDTTAFPGWPTGVRVWSSTTLPDGTNNAFVIYGVNARIWAEAKNSARYCALVRGGRN